MCLDLLEVLEELVRLVLNWAVGLVTNAASWVAADTSIVSATSAESVQSFIVAFVAVVL